MKTINTDAATMSTISNDGSTNVAAVTTQRVVNIRITNGEINGVRYYKDGEVRAGVSVESAQALIDSCNAVLISNDEVNKVIVEERAEARKRADEGTVAARNATPYSEWSKEELVAELERLTIPKAAKAPTAADQQMMAREIGTTANVADAAAADAANTPAMNSDHQNVAARATTTAAPKAPIGKPGTSKPSGGRR